MASFPALYRTGTEVHNPVVREFSVTAAHDPTIRSLSDSGYVTSRAKFTRIPERWVISYTWLSKANKNTLRTFEQDTVGIGSDSFTWTNPEDGATYTVRFIPPGIRYTSHDNVNWLFWMAEFELEEV